MKEFATPFYTFLPPQRPSAALYAIPNEPIPGDLGENLHERLVALRATFGHGIATRKPFRRRGVGSVPTERAVKTAFKRRIVNAKY